MLGNDGVETKKAPQVSRRGLRFFGANRPGQIGPQNLVVVNTHDTISRIPALPARPRS